ncbi:MAG: hypothetical protein JOY52_02430 [Hyphomicrobiales bacterium]|jgi:hypothetical protein|nr:hypothetical protein [Hyphomicrobiales bacterium]
MLARVSLVALVLASPAWADSDYPAGLFERSPVTDAPAADSRQPSPAIGQTTKPSGDRGRGGCHHYREWRYPYPQPC